MRVGRRHRRIHRFTWSKKTNKLYIRELKITNSPEETGLLGPRVAPASGAGMRNENLSLEALITAAAESKGMTQTPGVTAGERGAGSAPGTREVKTHELRMIPRKIPHGPPLKGAVDLSHFLQNE